MSVTAADALSVMPVTYTTFNQVINTLAGTVAHEIAHTLGVLNHEPGSPVNGVYSIMASGTSSPSLPIAARLTERQFLNIAGTQGGLSTPQVLLSAAGTTRVTDFNFDRATDGSDYNIIVANLGRSNTGVKTGDATNDRFTDGSDYNMVLAALGTTHDTIVGNDIPNFKYDPATGTLSVNTEGTHLNSMLITVPQP